MNFSYDGVINPYSELEYEFGGHETTFIANLFGNFTNDPFILFEVNPNEVYTSNNNILVTNAFTKNTPIEEYAKQLPYYKGVSISDFILKEIKSQVEKIYLKDNKKKFSVNNVNHRWEYQIENSNNLFLNCTI
jgi:hypothetical protein